MSKFIIKIFFLLFGMFLINNCYSQKKITFFEDDVKILSVDNLKSNNVLITLRFNEINFSDFIVNNNIFTKLTIKGFNKSYSTGEPDLPTFVKLISVPKDIDLSISILHTDTAIFNLSDIGIHNVIKPAVHSISKKNNEDSVVYKKGIAYNTDKYTQNSIVELKEVGINRDSKFYELTYSPVSYNAVRNRIITYNSVKVKIINNNSSFNIKTYNLFKSYKSTIKTEITTLNNTYVIVSPQKYKDTLQPFVLWKKQQGFNVVEAYIGEHILSNDKSEIKRYLRDLYENPPNNQQPLKYLLIIGDVLDIPSWNGTTESHITDLYYAEFTNDFLPELYYGRLSVSTVEQLKNIIDKILFVEKGLGDKDYQNKHLLISGVDEDHASVYGNGMINYYLKYYTLDNFGVTNNYYLYGSGSAITSDNIKAKQYILNDFTEGTGIVYYTAHCNASGWVNPEFKISDIDNVNNIDKYPVIISNCCESYKFNTNSFGEEIVRAKGKGAVAYIGATDYTYWDEDYYWGVGFVSDITSSPDYENTGLGAFDSWFHTHDEDDNNKSYNIAQIVNAGNMSVQSSTSQHKDYYWEVYQIMGDPSFIPVKYKLPKILANYNKKLKVGQDSIVVTTQKNAIVSLSQNGKMLDVNITNNNGECKLKFEALDIIGDKCLELVVSLPDYNTLIDSLDIIASDDAYLVYKDFVINRDKIKYGDTINIALEIENMGNKPASNVTAVFNSNSKWLVNTVDGYKMSIGDVNPNTVIITDNYLQIIIKDTTPNDTTINIYATIDYNGNTNCDAELKLNVNSPDMSIVDYDIDKTGEGNLDEVIDTNEIVNIDFYISNLGNVQVSNTTLEIISPDNKLLTVLSNKENIGGFDVGEVKSVPIKVVGGENIFPGTKIDLKYKMTAGINNILKYTGDISVMLGKEPEYNMSNDTVEIVSGYFYDSGGSSGKYGIQESYIITFIPHIKSQGVMVTFPEFELESSNTNNCYDELSVFNGMDINSPLIGEFCGKNIDDIYSQNKQGALTFRFTSDNSVTKKGWVGYISSSEKYDVTLKITDGVNLIDSAFVKFGYDVDTSLNGEVKFNNILGNKTKYYTIVKKGYLNFTDTIGRINTDTTITVLIKELPNVCFSVYDGLKPLDSVKVIFDNRELLTNSNGYVNFKKTDLGTKKFYTQAKGYIDTLAFITVTSTNACYNLQLRKGPFYKIKFIVSDRYEYLTKVSIEFSGRKVFTNLNGEVVIDSIYSANYKYIIYKNGYDTIQGGINIDRDTIKQIFLEKHLSVESGIYNLPYKIYPNPVLSSNEFYIKSIKDIDELKMFNYAGVLVLKYGGLPQELSVSTVNIKSGIYILQMKVGDRFYFEKIIIK